MNKGFTLIEVIAIIVIFVGIFLISFPTLTNMAKNDNEKMYTNMIDNLCTVGSEIELPITELMSYGSVDKDLVNPKTELSVENNTLRYTVLEDLSLNCEFIEE